MGKELVVTCDCCLDRITEPNHLILHGYVGVESEELAYFCNIDCAKGWGLAGFIDDPMWSANIKELEIDKRSLNCLKSEGIEFIGQLIQFKEKDVLRITNLGKKSVKLIIESLEKNHLKLGSSIPRQTILKNPHLRKKIYSCIDGEWGLHSIKLEGE